MSELKKLTCLRIVPALALVAGASAAAPTNAGAHRFPPPSPPAAPTGPGVPHHQPPAPLGHHHHHGVVHNANAIHAPATPDPQVPAQPVPPFEFIALPPAALSVE